MDRSILPKLSLPQKLILAGVLVINLDATAGTIITKFKPELPAHTASALTFNHLLADEKVTGKVTDDKGQPLPGVSVKVKGKPTGTVTNIDGAFTIDAPENATLVVTYVGFTAQEVAVNGQNSVNVKLLPSSSALNEVVVTALGIKRESKSLGYSTTTVSGEQLTQSRDVNLGNALTGKVAGVSVANNATGPTGSSRVVIRGNSSLTGNNQPLYVIDGVPFDNTNQNSAGQYGGLDLGDGLSNINPDDIANIQILKGAAASALYGYRGGNGAILITTKSGAKGKAVSVELNNNFTFNTIIDYRDFQTTYGQGSQGLKPTTAASALNTGNSSWGAKLDGSTAVNLLGQNYAYSLGPDNWKNFYKTGLNNQSSVAVSGSTDKINYRVGISNLYNKSNIPNSNLKQQGFNINTTYNISKKLQFTLTANYVFEQAKNRTFLSDASTNVNATLMYLANSFDVRWLKPGVKADGTELTPTNGLYFNNPYFLTEYHQNSTDRNRLTGAATLKYNILDWLYVQGQVSRDGYILDYRKVTPTGTAYAPGGELSEYERNYHELNGNFLIGMNKKITEDFSITANLGGNSQDDVNKSYGLDGTASPFILPYLYTANNIANRPYTQTYTHYRVNSFYGSVDLGYKDWLFLNVTGRNDWFSTLASNSNSYFYPSVTGSFVFSQALKLPTWVSFGKLRASYAASSNGTSAYQNYLTYGIRTYTTNGNSIGYITQSTIPNANLKPVDIKEQEVGLNMQFLDNRLGFDVAVYHKQTTDDIVSVSTSNASGYNAAIQNVGKIRNRGIEFLLTGTPVKARNFSWNSSFNIAYNNNKVLYLGEGVNSLSIDGAIANRGDGVIIANVLGRYSSQILGYAYLRDANGNKIYGTDGQPLRTSTVVPLGSGIYKTTGGFNNEFRYKNFSMSFLFDFKYGAKIYSGTNLALYADGLQKTTLQGREGGYVGVGVTQAGTPNTTAVNAQTYWTNLTGSNNIAEEFVYDASFIKLRQFIVGYTLPTSVFKGGFVKGASISFVTRNLATLMKHTPNIDPESNYSTSNGQGLEANGYPPTRSLGFNLNVKF
ncbi:SusC/RagA family TonB-linked outer membrane protein [Mucilaginibacter robiniae]|uniref:SusC/RagA family TonB-linked outer membrane protein n=2 Tax=Mucilaginibacter robiniae TaxID=2728022 RepID=A0A7L5EC09_9SPHI|nr:SusC/RagA family TonB-linked outer membrane protein [Mucilaginibacter robiniae]